MPTKWDLPDELFTINLPQSENPTINLCDALVRKAAFLRDNFKGKRRPAYEEHNMPEAPGLTKSLSVAALPPISDT